MSAPGISTKIHLRVVDQNTGTVIVDDLPHPHQGQWTTNALANTIPGAAGLGTFRFPLYAPNTEEWKRAKPYYDKLRFGHRIEGYLGDISGTPRWSGVITDYQKSLRSPWQISGFDTLWWLQQTQVLPDQLVESAGATADVIISAFKRGLECVIDETCPSSHLTNYTQTPAARWTATSEPITAAPSFTCSTVGSNSFLVSNATYASTTWGQSRIDGFFYIQASSDTTNAGTCSLVVASDATGANCVVGEAQVRASGNNWVVDGLIYSVAAGTGTVMASNTGLLTLPSNAARVQVTMVSYYQGSLSYWALFINGAFACRWNWGNGAGSPAGRYGAKFFASTGTSQVWLDRISFRYANQNSPRFATGTISSGTVLWTGTNLNGQTALDMVQQAAALQNWLVRKTPGAGHKSDSIDAGAAPGTDLSKEITFEEGQNLTDLQVVANADYYSLDLRVAATPGGDVGGGITYPATLTAGDLALMDTVLNAGLTTNTGVYQYAQLVQAAKATQGQAKIATVLREPATAERWRELDYVTVNAPTLDISNQKCLVLGYTFTEGTPEIQVLLDQLPATQSRQASDVRRLVDSMRQVANTFKTR